MTQPLKAAAVSPSGSTVGGLERQLASSYPVSPDMAYRAQRVFSSRQSHNHDSVFAWYIEMAFEAKPSHLQRQGIELKLPAGQKAARGQSGTQPPSGQIPAATRNRRMLPTFRRHVEQGSIYFSLIPQPTRTLAFGKATIISQNQCRTGLLMGPYSFFLPATMAHPALLGAMAKCLFPLALVTPLFAKGGLSLSFHESSAMPVI